MLYAFYHYTTPYKQSQVESWDGVVIRTTPAMAWAIGVKLERLIDQGWHEGYTWKILPESMRSSSLSEHHRAPLSDKALFQRISP